VRRRHPDDEIPSVDPGDSESIIGDFPVHAAAAEEAIAAARAAQPAWGALPTADRATALRKLRAELRNRGDELAALLSAETGRPLWEAREEVLALHVELDGYIEHCLAELSLCRLPPVESRVEFHPVGVIAVLSPYPQPAMLMHLDAVAAMAAGCTVVCKPSELTPGTAQLYAEVVHEADLPRGVFNMVQGDASVGNALALDPDVDGVLFAGSLANGEQLLRTLSGGPKMVRTLVSGNATAVVLDDAHLVEAAYQIVIAACTSAGQRCTSVHRVLVHRRVAPQLTDSLVHLLEQLRVGYATDPDTFMGPLIGSTAVERYLSQLKRIGDLGGQELVHGAPLSSRRRGFYVTPSLHTLSLEAIGPLGDPELFGPLLVVSTFDDLDQGTETIRASARPCTVLSVFTRSHRALERARRGYPAALCLQNLPTTHLPARLPLQPWSQGNGHAVGTLTARSCARLTVVVEREAALDVTMLPPGLPRQ